MREAALTADLVAQAIVAAARVLQDDPVRAMTSTSKSARRSLSAAAGGLNRALGRPVVEIAPVLGVSPATVFTARHRASALWCEAEDKAAAVVEGQRPRVEPARPPAPAAAAPARSPSAIKPPKAVAPPPAPAPKSRPPSLPGKFSCVGQPVRFRAEPPPKVDLPLGDRILAYLADKPASAMTLAAVLDAKELIVSQTLRQLTHEGCVQPTPIEGVNPRQWVWRLRRGPRDE